MPKAKASNLSALRKFALTLADVEEGLACAGTSLEKNALKVRKKTFVFLSEVDVMLKLAESLPAATRLAAEEPERYQVGAHGWTTIKVGKGETLPSELIEGWIRESYSLFAPKPKRTK